MGEYYNTSVINKGKARVHGKWVNYFYNGWKPLNLNFVNDGSNFTSNGGPFTFQSPQFSNGIAFLSITNKYDIFSKSTISDSDMVFEIVAENTNGAAGVLENDKQVWYHNAFGNGISLRNTIWHGRAPRLTKEVVIDPTVVSNQDVTVSWLVTSPNALTMINGERPKNPNGESWTGAIGDTTDVTGPISVHYYAGGLSPVRGSGFKKPVAWYYSNGKTIFADVTVSITVVDTSTIRITKTINKDIIAAAGAAGSLLFADDVQTIYPDPHAETTSCDGQCQKNGAYDTTFATYISGAANDGAASYTINRAGWATLSNYFSRAYTLFDCSGVSGTVSGVDWAATVSQGGNVRLRLTEATTSSATNIVIADYQNTYNNNDTSWTDTFTVTSDVPVALNATGIAGVQAAVDAAGVVKICVRHYQDYYGATTGDREGDMQMYSAETAGTGSDPYLEVTTGAAGIIYNQRQILLKNKMSIQNSRLLIGK